MERGNLGRWLLIAAGIFLFIRFGTNFLCGERFHAQLTTRGASLKHYQLTTSKYRKDGKQIDISTTPDQELYQQLRFGFSNLVAKDERQVDADEVDWALGK